MKNTFIISGKNSDLTSQKSCKDYIGKKVYTNNGNLLGSISDVKLANEKLVGFIVKGKKIMFIDKEFLYNESEKAIMLSMEPIVQLYGKIVFDSVGKTIGKVIEVERKGTGNSFESIKVKANMFSKAITIPKEDIEVWKENIILNKPYTK